MSGRYRCILGLCVALAGLVTIAFASLRVSTSHSRVGPKEIKWGEIRGFDYWMQLCGQATKFVEIDGTKYLNVTGRPPYCVHVPEANAILFARLTLASKDGPFIYFYDIDTTQIRCIDTRGLFGYLLADQPISLLPGESPSEDRVASASSDRIEFVSTRGDKHYRFAVDLRSLELTRIPD